MKMETYQPTPTQIECDLAILGYTTINKRSDGSPEDPNNSPNPPMPEEPPEVQPVKQLPAPKS
jgi:hypothetical protein